MSSVSDKLKDSKADLYMFSVGKPLGLLSWIQIYISSDGNILFAFPVTAFTAVFIQKSEAIGGRF